MWLRGSNPNLSSKFIKRSDNKSSQSRVNQRYQTKMTNVAKYSSPESYCLALHGWNVFCRYFLPCELCRRPSVGVLAFVVVEVLTGSFAVFVVLIGPVIFFVATGNDPCSASCYATARQDDGKCCVSSGEGRCFCMEGGRSYYEDAGSGVIGFCVVSILVLVLCLGFCQRSNYREAKEVWERHHNPAEGADNDVPSVNKAMERGEEENDPTASVEEPSNVTASDPSGSEEAPARARGNVTEYET